MILELATSDETRNLPVHRDSVLSRKMGTVDYRLVASEVLVFLSKERRIWTSLLTKTQYGEIYPSISRK